MLDVPEVQLSETTPRSFWKHHISQRQPVVIHGVADNWSSFTDDSLVERAGDAVVMVEHRSGSKDAYGQGKKTPMALRDFIKHMQQGDSNLYMSTQEVGVGHDGHPLLYGAPLVDMEGTFPLEQPLLQHLVPQSINMWMGCAPEGSSSGLHHDFHDNLYILLRGSKRFRLFPPQTAPDMYVTGQVRHIYANGRIVYDGQGDIRPDGSNVHDVKVWEAHRAADRAAAAAGAAGSSAEADEAEALLEQQLEHMLDEGAAHDDSSLMDDYMEDSDENPSDSSTSSQAADTDSPSEGSRGRGSDSSMDLQQLQQTHHQQRHQHQQRKQQQHQQQHQQQKQAVRQTTQPPALVQGPPPPSFSQVQLDLPEAELRWRFPRFPGLSAAAVVVLQAGDMLYLPAGWFHEVTSFGGPGLDGGHLAINYWFHPPDNLDPGKAGFNQPYSSPYYPTLWAERRSWVQKESRDWWQQQQQQHHGRRQQQQQPHDSSGQVHKLPSQQPKQQKQKQQQAEARHSSRSKRARIQWAPSVGDPGNVYEANNTRAGTATGTYKVLPQHSGLMRDASASSSEDEAAAPDDDAQHRQLGKEVAEGIDALEAYFGDNPDAMQELLGQFLAERRARLAAASREPAQQGTRLPRLRGRRHHYTVVLKLEPRRPKPKPQQRRGK